jgi:uracil phosphoribosyltransferase
MPLSIYTVKHPLVLSWLSCLLREQITTLEEFDLIQKIVFALIYEATRKFIDIHELYLRRLDDLEEIYILENKFSYCIITDIYFSQISSKDFLSLLPQSSIYTLSLHSRDEKQYLKDKYDLMKPNIKIIILQKLLDDKIIRAITNLMLDLQLSSHNLQICCLSCSSKNLDILSQTHPNLQIYTIKIIEH